MVSLQEWTGEEGRGNDSVPGTARRRNEKD